MSSEAGPAACDMASVAVAPPPPSPHVVVVPGQTVVLQINNDQNTTCQAKTNSVVCRRLPLTIRKCCNGAACAGKARWRRRGCGRETRGAPAYLLPSLYLPPSLAHVDAPCSRRHGLPPEHPLPPKPQARLGPAAHTY